MLRFPSIVAVAVLSLAGLNFLAAPARAASPDPDPYGVLAGAAETALGVYAVRYEAEWQPIGPAASMTPRLRGLVTLAETASDLPLMRIEMEVTPPGRTDKASGVVTSDGRMIRVVDHTNRTYFERELVSSRDLLNNFMPLVLLELVRPNPFDPELRAGGLNVAAAAEIDGVLCDAVCFEQGSMTTHWYFGRDDRLPRAVRRLVQSPAGPSSLNLTVRKVQVDPPIVPETFAAARPAGYQDLVVPVQQQQKPGRRFLPTGQAAPDWKLPTPEGGEVALKDLRGQVVLLDFWATWCGPCKLAMPGLQRLHEKYQGKPVKIFGVNCMERSDPVRFMQAGKYTYPLLLKGDAVAAQYLVGGIPTFYLIGPDGRVEHAGTGYSAALEHELETRIDDLLAKAGSSKPAPSPE